MNKSIELHAYSTLLVVHIKQYLALQTRYDRATCSALLEHIHMIFLQQLKEQEVLDYHDDNQYVFLLQETDIKTLYERIFQLDDAIYYRKDPRFHQSLFLGIGIYFIQEQDNYETAFMNANIARLYSLDADKLNTHIELYQPSFQDQLSRISKLEERMRKALANKEFQVFLQPKVDLHSEEIIGCEALIRWFDQELGEVTPNEFIPLAERNGFIREIDQYMFEQVCMLLQHFHKFKDRSLSISVNLSRLHFEEQDALDPFIKIFHNYNFPASLLDLEITESAMNEKITHLPLILSQIHRLGWTCSMDDFGSGYSSLASLQNLAFDTIKLDRSLFINENERSLIMVRSILSMAHKLHMKTLCEGIERVAQVQWLKQQECDYIQGYVFYKAMPIHTFITTFLDM